jgi:hypothetical protein
MNSNDDNKIYKDNANAFKNELKGDIERNMEKFSDPLVIGELLYKLLEERENTNRILKNILVKLERLEQPAKKEISEEMLLPKVDEDIMKFVSDKKHATAEEVRKKFNYRGTNAASSRLNRLYQMGLLGKKQVGKSVYFFLK